MHLNKTIKLNESKISKFKIQFLNHWCSNKLKNKIFKNFIKEKNNLYTILTYNDWFNYENLLNKFCFNINLSNINYIYINFEQYNYNFIEYMYLYLYKDNILKLSILDFCSAIGIFIPHYCYHPDLSIAGNCRMCLIQLDGSIKPIASCAIPISNKMIINTQSIFVKKAQEVLWNFYY